MRRKPPGKRANANTAAILNDYAAGISVADIAKRLGSTPSKVRALVTQYGVCRGVALVRVPAADVERWRKIEAAARAYVDADAACHGDGEQVSRSFHDMSAALAAMRTALAP